MPEILLTQNSFETLRFDPDLTPNISKHLPPQAVWSRFGKYECA